MLVNNLVPVSGYITHLAWNIKMVFIHANPTMSHAAGLLMPWLCRPPHGFQFPARVDNRYAGTSARQNKLLRQATTNVCRSPGYRIIWKIVMSVYNQYTLRLIVKPAGFFDGVCRTHYCSELLNHVHNSFGRK